MKKYKYFTQEGNSYKYNEPKTIKIILILLFVGLAVVSYNKNAIPITKFWAALILSGLITMLTNKFVIDTDRKLIHAKCGIFMSSKTIPFDKIVDFEILTSSVNFIPSAVFINIYYTNTKGKEKLAKAVQAFSKTRIQNVLNEVDEIMGREEQ